MNHFFSPIKSSDQCEICGFNFIAHTKLAICNSCKSSGNVDAILVHDEKVLLCEACQQKNLLETIKANQDHIDLAKLTNPITNEIAQLGLGITYKQDLMNTFILSHEELRSSCKDEDEFSLKMVDRYVALREIIHNADVERLAIATKLREIGAIAKKEYQAKIQESDQKYVPDTKAPKIKPKIKKANSPLERMIQQIAISKGISNEKAKELIEKNPALMNALLGSDD